MKPCIVAPEAGPIVPVPPGVTGHFHFHPDGSRPSGMLIDSIKVSGTNGRPYWLQLLIQADESDDLVTVFKAVLNSPRGYNASRRERRRVGGFPPANWPAGRRAKVTVTN